MSDLVLSVDVGGTKTLVGVFDGDGRPAGEWEQPTPGGADDVARAVTFARACAAAAPGRVVAVAAGFPEYVTPNGELTSREVITWTEQPAVALAAAFDDLGIRPRRCTVGSDVRLGALGEAVHGAGRGHSSFLYVSLGTGLSCAFVIDGVPWPGARGEAIALGEHMIAVEGYPTLERYASGAALAARYRQRTGTRLTRREVTERAGRGDPVATEILDSAGTALGDALADVVAVLDPHVVVLGGGLGAAHTGLHASATARYTTRTSGRPGAAPLLTAWCGHRSGLLGGEVAARRSLEAHRA